ncbi:MAG: ABC transporter permease DevC [Pseudomonadota bacterium]
MTGLLAACLGRLPIGWLQLSHNKTRLFAAIAGVAFANILVFVQLGILGALNGTIVVPYNLFQADILLSASDANTLTDGSPIARARGFEALGVPGVADMRPLYIGNFDWYHAEGGSSNVQVYGIDPAAEAFLSPPLNRKIAQLALEDTVVLDEATRGLPNNSFSSISAETPHSFEARNRTLSAVATVNIGGGFSADGVFIAADQTFLRLFPARFAGAPDHILIKIEEGIDPTVVVDRISAVLPDTVQVRTLTDAAGDDQRYQTTQRPTGIIFGLGVLIGMLVGIVIVYQILSTDVADHLKEYATFKAMGYGHTFFLGIIFEQAAILAFLGFVPGFLISTAIYGGLSAAAGLPVEMDVIRALSVFIGTVIACAASGAVATRRLAAADPADLF